VLSYRRSLRLRAAARNTIFDSLEPITLKHMPFIKLYSSILNQTPGMSLLCSILLSLGWTMPNNGFETFLGENPYDGMTGEEVFTFVASGHRLPRTPAMSSDLYV